MFVSWEEIGVRRRGGGVETTSKVKTDVRLLSSQGVRKRWGRMDESVVSLSQATECT